MASAIVCLLHYPNSLWMRIACRSSRERHRRVHCMVFQDSLVEFSRGSTYYDVVVHKALALRVPVDPYIVKAVVAYDIGCKGWNVCYIVEQEASLPVWGQC